MEPYKMNPWEVMGLQARVKAQAVDQTHLRQSLRNNIRKITLEQIDKHGGIQDEDRRRAIASTLANLLDFYFNGRHISAWATVHDPNLFMVLWCFEGEEPEHVLSFIPSGFFCEVHVDYLVGDELVESY